MHEKGMSQTIGIVVAAIVILITALIIITIFGSGISPIADYSARRNVCLQMASTSCASYGRLPNDWYAPVQYREGSEVKTGSCAQMEGLVNCRCEANTLKCE